MNTRVILYGAVGLVLFMALGGGGGSSAESEKFFPLSLRQQSGYKNECIKGIDSFEATILAKIKFCECVVSGFDDLINVDEELQKKHAAFTEAYTELAESPQDASRALASAHISDTTMGWSMGPIFSLLSVEGPFKYGFKQLQPQVDELSKDFDAAWKKSTLSCTQKSPVTGQAP